MASHWIVLRLIVGVVVVGLVWKFVSVMVYLKKMRLEGHEVEGYDELACFLIIMSVVCPIIWAILLANEACTGEKHGAAVFYWGGSALIALWTITWWFCQEQRLISIEKGLAIRRVCYRVVRRVALRYLVEGGSPMRRAFGRILLFCLPLPDMRSKK